MPEKGGARLKKAFLKGNIQTNKQTNLLRPAVATQHSVFSEGDFNLPLLSSNFVRNPNLPYWLGLIGKKVSSAVAFSLHRILLMKSS